MCLTLVLLYPITSHVLTRLPHDLGDPLLSVSLLSWNARTIPLTERWWNGFFFAPAGGVLAFSDHRLGESLIASPLIWLGASPIAAYNITLLLTFPLCAIAAHLLAKVITGHDEAAIVAGLAYGFSPYRLAHIEHIELLAAYGMPLALAALHRSLDDARPRWAVWFGAALLIQALSCSYYLLFFLVLLALWAAWFFRREHFAAAGRAAAALVTVSALILPLAWSYRSIHEHYGFARGLRDVIQLSADVTSYVTASPLLWWWGWTAPLNGPERQLMPGLAVTLIAAAGAVEAWRRHPNGATGSAVSRTFAAAAALFAGVAAFTAIYGPWEIGYGWLAASSRTAFKPMSIAVVALTASIATSRAARDAWKRRSPFAFYLIAAVVLGLCSLGPAPTFMGRQFLYEPPYAWLMRLAVFGDSIRAPARFAMPAFLALSIAAAIAYGRLPIRRKNRQIVLAVAAAVIALEAWPSTLPMVDPPPAWRASPEASDAAAVLDLPVGDVEHDVAAMYGALNAHTRSVNGYSGFQPPHYEVLRLAVNEKDQSALDALATSGPLLIGVQHTLPDAAQWRAWLDRQHLQARFDDRDRTWFLLPRHAAAPPVCAEFNLPVVSIHDGRNEAVTLPWIAPSQRRGDSLIVELNADAAPCAVRMSLGEHASLYVRRLVISSSIDGRQWHALATEPGAGRALLGAIANPRDPQLTFAVPPGPARFLRLEVDADADAGWAVNELRISGSRSE